MCCYDIVVVRGGVSKPCSGMAGGMALIFVVVFGQEKDIRSPQLVPLTRQRVETEFDNMGVCPSSACTRVQMRRFQVCRVGVVETLLDMVKKLCGNLFRASSWTESRLDIGLIVFVAFLLQWGSRESRWHLMFVLLCRGSWPRSGSGDAKISSKAEAEIKRCMQSHSRWLKQWPEWGIVSCIHALTIVMGGKSRLDRDRVILC